MIYKIENIVFIIKKDAQQHLCLGRYSVDEDSNIETFKKKIKEDCEYTKFYLLSRISDEKYDFLNENLQFDYKITFIKPEKEKSLDELYEEMYEYEPTGYPFESQDEDIYRDLYVKYIEKSFEDYCKKNEYNKYQFEGFECFWEETYEKYIHNVITALEFYCDDNYIQATKTVQIYDDGEDTQHTIDVDITIKVKNLKDDKEITEITEINDPKLQMFIDYLKQIWHRY